MRAVYFVTLALLALAVAGCAQSDHFTSVEQESGLANGQGRAVLPAGTHLRSVVHDGLVLTEDEEHWKAHLYDDVAGYCTIGYGHLIALRPCKQTSAEVIGPYAGGLTPPQGEKVLISDMAMAQYDVMNAVTAPLSDAEFAALCDFVFNVGGANFRSSTLLRVINDRQADRVAGQFRRWVLAKGKPYRGLRLRREAEIRLYFNGQPQSKGVAQPGEVLTPIDIEVGERQLCCNGS